MFLDEFLTHICLIPAVWSRPLSFPVSFTTFASFPLAEPFWFSLCHNIPSLFGCLFLSTIPITHKTTIQVNVSLLQFWTYYTLALKFPGFLLFCRINTNCPNWHKWCSLIHKQSLKDFLHSNIIVIYTEYLRIIIMRDIACLFKKMNTCFG